MGKIVGLRSVLAILFFCGLFARSQDDGSSGGGSGGGILPPVNGELGLFPSQDPAQAGKITVTFTGRVDKFTREYDPTDPNDAVLKQIKDDLKKHNTISFTRTNVSTIGGATGKPLATHDKDENKWKAKGDVQGAILEISFEFTTFLPKGLQADELKEVKAHEDRHIDIDLTLVRFCGASLAKKILADAIGKPASGKGDSEQAAKDDWVGSGVRQQRAKWREVIVTLLGLAASLYDTRVEIGTPDTDLLADNVVSFAEDAIVECWKTNKDIEQFVTCVKKAFDDEIKRLKKK